MKKVQIRDCTIYHGDCMEVLPQLEPADLLVADPPYGVRPMYIA